ncbi:Glutathione S-transferase 8 [Podila epicladia]|nr:Glutathione S-transferase 8 [Podila epicladia]KAG0092666.1 Glutathione S-transferase 8 [Podila epicladia]
MTESIPTLYVLNRNYSSWSLRAWLALRVLGVNFETVVLTVGTKELPDVDHPDFPALMARAGPTSKVPALHITKPNGENHIVFESLAIMEYLAEDYPSLWPTNKFERAYARSLASEMATSFGPIRSYGMNIRVQCDFDPALWNEGVEKNLARLSSIWEELRAKAVKNQATDKGFLFGGFTALDAMYAPLAHRLTTYSLRDKVQGEHARAYVQSLLDAPEMQEWSAAAKAEPWVVASDELYPINKN